MNVEEAAAYLGITTDELMMSFYRGLPPGTLGEKIEGELYWAKEDLLPPPTPNSIAANPEKAAEMVQAIGQHPSAFDDSPHVGAQRPEDTDQATDTPGSGLDPKYCYECEREFVSAAGKLSHDRAYHEESEAETE